MIRFFREMPIPSKKSLVLLTLSLALPLSIRAGGLLSFAYLGLFAAVDLLMKTGVKKIGSQIFINNIKTYSKYIIPILIAGYFLGLVFWPYGIEAPFSAPFKSLSEFSNFSTSIGQIFEGEMIPSSQLPWYYLLKYIGITTPLVTLLGLIIFLPMAWLNKEKWNHFVLFILLFTLIFPIAYIIYKEANVYGGLRHVLFVLPSLLALSALGWYGLFTSFKAKAIKGVALAAFVVLSFLPLKYLIAHHPYGVVYFNEFVGGTEGAYGKYEMDYYGTSLKNCLRWLEENENIFNRTEPLLMRTNAERNLRYIRGFEGQPRKLPDRDIVQLQYSRYNQRSEDPWDIAIWQNIYIPPSQLTNGTYPNEEILYTAGVGKAVFAAVVRRPSNEDYKGFQALNAGNNQQAIKHFRNYIEVHKGNETVYQAMARVYFDTGEFKNAARAAGNALKLDRSLIQAYNIAGLSYLNLKDYNNAINAFNGMVKSRPNPTAYYYLAICYANLNDRNTALAYINNALQMNPNFKEAQQLKQQLTGGR
ncbi:MAG: tetratricopeptide repeat protein, partial [Chitinophagales bacterium]